MPFKNCYLTLKIRFVYIMCLMELYIVFIFAKNYFKIVFLQDLTGFNISNIFPYVHAYTSCLRGKFSHGMRKTLNDPQGRCICWHVKGGGGNVTVVSCWAGSSSLSLRRAFAVPSCWGSISLRIYCTFNWFWLLYMWFEFLFLFLFKITCFECNICWLYNLINLSSIKQRNNANVELSAVLPSCRVMSLRYFHPFATRIHQPIHRSVWSWSSSTVKRPHYKSIFLYLGVPIWARLLGTLCASELHILLLLLFLICEEVQRWIFFLSCSYLFISQLKIPWAD